MEQHLEMIKWRLISHHSQMLKLAQFRECCEEGYVAVGIHTGDVAAQHFHGRIDIYDFLQQHAGLLVNPDNSWLVACNIWGLYHDMQRGDLILLKTGNCPDPMTKIVQITGDYYYEPHPHGDKKHYPHRRPIAVRDDLMYRQAGGLQTDWLYHGVPDGETTYVAENGSLCALLPCMTAVFPVAA